MSVHQISPVKHRKAPLSAEERTVRRVASALTGLVYCDHALVDTVQAQACPYRQYVCTSECLREHIAFEDRERWIDLGAGGEG